MRHSGFRNSHWLALLGGIGACEFIPAGLVVEPDSRRQSGGGCHPRHISHIFPGTIVTLRSAHHHSGLGDAVDIAALVAVASGKGVTPGLVIESDTDGGARGI